MDCGKGRERHDERAGCAPIRVTSARVDGSDRVRDGVDFLMGVCSFRLFLPFLDSTLWVSFSIQVVLGFFPSDIIGVDLLLPLHYSLGEIAYYGPPKAPHRSRQAQFSFAQLQGPSVLLFLDDQGTKYFVPSLTSC